MREVLISNKGQGAWLSFLRRYVALMALGNLAWEFAHMPLYTLWGSGTRGEIIFAAIHCAGGDILIALAALVAALVLFGSSRWPEQTYGHVALATVVIGLAYTLFSEWLNIEIRASWAYSDLMPIIPLLDAGLSPVAQWLVLPGLSLWWLRQRARRY